MRRRLRILCAAMSVMLLFGCGGKEESLPTQPMGTLAAIEYSRTVGMVWGEDFFVRVNQREIQSMEYFVEEIAEYRIEEGLPLENGQWQQLETAALALWPALTEVKPEKETLWQRLFPLPEPLDGGDSSRLVFHWDTPEGIVSIEYSWNNDDPKAQQLFALLRALQDTAKGE